MSELAQRLRTEADNVDNSNTWDTWAVDTKLLRDAADVLDALIHQIETLRSMQRKPPV